MLKRLVWTSALMLGIGSGAIESAHAESVALDVTFPTIDPNDIPKPKLPRILRGTLMTSAGTSSVGGVGFFELIAGSDSRLVLAPSVGYFIADDVEVATAVGMNARFGEGGGVTFSFRGAAHWYLEVGSQMFRLGAHVGLGDAYRSTVGAYSGASDGMLIGGGLMWVVPLTRYFAALIGAELNCGLSFSDDGKSTLALPMGLTGFVAHF